MLFRPSTLLSLSAAFSLVLSQASVPSDLSSGFDVNSITLQASFTGDAVEGFADGSSISLKEASNTPTFALGDSSGINTAISFVIMMVDTTGSQPTLHYLQTGFTADGDETGISSTTSPLLAYQPPGSFGETGTRNYVFLLYQQPTGSISGLPSKGSPFDISSFQGTNSLKAPEAGISMSVDVGGSGSSNSNNQPQQSSSAQTEQTTEASQPSSTQQANTAQQTTFQTSAAGTSTSFPPSSSSSSTQSINSSIFASITSDTTTELSTGTVLPTAAASVGAVGAGPAGGVASSIPTSLSGTAVIEPTGSAGATSSASASSVHTGAAVPLRVGGREVLAGLGAVAVIGILL